MSRKTNTPNENKQTTPKKSGKAIIAAAVAVVVIAAVLVGIFVVKPAIDKNTEPTTVPIVTNSPSEGEQYSYIDYKGVKMPVEFVEIFNKAEIDNRNACKEYGVALEIGDRDISRSEFGIYYIDQYYLQLREIEYSIEQKGSNLTGYDPEKLPDVQNAVGVNYTFAEDFTRKAIEHIQTNYASFDLALENGTELTEEEISNTISGYERVLEYAKYAKEEMTPDAYVQKVYGAGTTYAMFAAREIIQAYARIHEERTADEYFDNVGEEEAKAVLDADATRYKVIKARIFPIEAEYDPEEISLVSTEEEYIEFAQNNYPGNNYAAKYETLCHYVSYDTIGRGYGYEVADWMFSEDRVPGEFGLVQGTLYECFIYIDKPAFLDTSCDVITYEFTYPEGIDKESFNVMANDIQEMYDGWVEQKLSEEEFKKACLETGDGFERTYRTGDLFFVVNSWILDDSRKSGDISMFNDGKTVYIIYYCHNNPEDFDWYQKVRETISSDKYVSEYNEFVEENHQVKRDEKVIIQAQKSANVKITENINKSKS